MPAAAFFRAFGFFTVDEFLDVSLCDRILAQARDRAWDLAPVYGGAEPVNEDFRRTLMTRLPTAERTEVEARLTSVKPMMESHFQVALGGFEKPQLLHYRTGDFFAFHRDSTSSAHVNELAEKRLVSVAISLNSQCEAPSDHHYCGGSLTFYRLINDSRAEDYGFPLTGRAGQLVAFRSDIPHEVKPVTHGDRYTLVTWYFKA